MTWTYNKPKESKVDFKAQDRKNITYCPTPCVNVSGGEITDCVNNPVPLDPLLTGAVVKVPAVLAELTVQFNVNATIDLPETVTEIKYINKRLKVTQCLLLQNTNMLFIEGFVRKNIQYATKKCATSEGVCGDIRHCTVDVPFKCTTPLTFNGLDPLPVIPTSRTGFEYLADFDVKGPQFSNKDQLQTGDFTEFNQISTEFFNELPYCELISSRIVEFDEFLNPRFIGQEKDYYDQEINVPFEEIEFKSIKEKMVIFLTLKVLQNRQVAIPPIVGIDC